MSARTIAGALGAAAVFALSACSSSDSSQDAANTATPPAPAPAPPPAPDNFPQTRLFFRGLITPNSPDNYARPAYPVHYDAAVLAGDNTPADNPVDDRIATLGRVLFFDSRLSINQASNCGTCHRPATGFTDPARFSAGFDGQLTANHSMRLANVRFYTAQKMFWDKRSATIEAQALVPITSPIEMGFTTDNGGVPALIDRLTPVPFYKELFPWAFGDATITIERIQKALGQFQRAMVSAGSRFDDGFAAVYDAGDPERGIARPFPNFTAVEERGKQLFLRPVAQGGANCAVCHVPPTFALIGNSLSTGLDLNENRIFKSPSLKNVAVNGPYMHDGRFATLEQVVDFYIRGIQEGGSLDPRLRNPDGTPQVLALSTADRDALVAFMKTLTDTQFLADRKFVDPFRFGAN